MILKFLLGGQALFGGDLVEDYCVRDMEGGRSIRRTRIVSMIGHTPSPLSAEDVLRLPVTGPYCFWWRGLRR